MTQYNNLYVNLLNSQLNKLKSVIKNETEVLLRLPSNIISNSDDETNLIKLQIFVKLLQIIYQLLSSYQRLSYLK